MGTSAADRPLQDRLTGSSLRTPTASPTAPRTDSSRHLQTQVPNPGPPRAENKDIVVKDKNGAYKLEVPTLPPILIGEDGEELVEMEENFNPAELTGREKEKFEQALMEMMIRHRNRMSDDEPDEILDMVHESLRKKVASLDDDNWMFEPEKDTFSN
ncbi:hypothetical protein N7452_001299 [Penicillium brevicompactum]|uniref:Uncharacterized protein n=1 Tax=Penicillium brevicompactum TaxID=5074 RepID=A0A9W9R2A3_PENBR|nr:hypothetical protein N7452_001299 [Penicillium brevicompactum]